MKKYTFLTLILVSALAFNTAAYAIKHVVLVGNFFFNPSSLNVNVGDTVRWVWSAGNHTTTSTPGAIPSGAASWDTLINNTNTFYEYKVTAAGSYAYVCTPHAPGMAGSFTATAFTPTLSVSPSSRSVISSAGTTTFSVISNSAWTASSNANWCTVDPSGSGNTTITATFAANTTNLIRIATITVTVTGLIPQMVTISQAASTVGVGEQFLSDLQVFPNPTKGVFKFTAGRMNDHVLKVTVMDVSGKEILSRVCEGTDGDIFDITNAPRGCYFIRINSENTSQIRRIVLID